MIKKSMDNLARYIIWASFSQERMTYHLGNDHAEYRSKDEKETSVFDALEWLAAMCGHVPKKGKQMVRYYGHYSNVSRGKRKNLDADDKNPCILEPELTGKTFPRNWARLIRKIYEVDHLICHKCAREMKVIAIINDGDVNRKILKHLGLWDLKRKISARAHAPLIFDISKYDEPAGPSVEESRIAPEYPVEADF